LVSFQVPMNYKIIRIYSQRVIHIHTVVSASTGMIKPMMVETVAVTANPIPNVTSFG
jgi:hypothetical protein